MNPKEHIAQQVQEGLKRARNSGALKETPEQKDGRGRVQALVARSRCMQRNNSDQQRAAIGRINDANPKKVVGWPAPVKPAAAPSPAIRGVPLAPALAVAPTVRKPAANHFITPEEFVAVVDRATMSPHSTPAAAQAALSEIREAHGRVDVRKHGSWPSAFMNFYQLVRMAYLTASSSIGGLKLIAGARRKLRDSSV